MKIKNLEGFQQHLKASSPHGLSSLYLLVIPDDFERRRWMDTLASLALAPDQPLTRWSAAEASLSLILTELSSPSLFGPDPVTWIDEAEKFSKKQAQELIDFWTQHPLKGRAILGARTKSSLYSFVEKQGILFDLSEEKSWEKEKRLTQQLSERARQAGKRVSPEVLQWLFEHVEKELSFLQREMDKLICFAASRSSIELSDVAQVSVSSRKQTAWQLAEEMVWEGKWIEAMDEEMFYGVVPAARHQLQLGRKIGSFLDAKMSFPDIGARLPKVWPKVLEKRLSQTSQLGSAYFQKGLDLLFQLETQSRSGSVHILALFDWFQASLGRRCKP